MKRLKFVDKKRFKRKKGVMLLPKSQLVLVALKKGKVVNYKTIAYQIKRAGYQLGKVFNLPKSKLPASKKRVR